MVRSKLNTFRCGAVFLPRARGGVTTQTSGEIVIQRVTYNLAGQAIAVRVTGDPDPTNNGLFYLHNDHLGSVSAMSDVNGDLVPGSTARYTPFGGWRTEPGTNPTITDRGYTGHKSNNSGANDLGLIYMNARYYVSGIGRFASADTIVPDPANPQSFNRYSYVFNNPLKLTDPSGHCPWCLITGAIGGAITGGTYLITTPSSEWKASEFILTTSIGTAGGL